MPTTKMSKLALSRKRFMNSSRFQSANYMFKKQREKRTCVVLQPLKEEELSKSDLELISKEIMLISQQGEHIGV